MKRKTKTGTVMVFVLILSVLFVHGTVQAADKSLKVGIIMPLSGPISFVGVGLSRAVKLYFDKGNDEGGLKLGGKTYKIDLIVEDSKFDPTVASTAAKKLVYKDGAKFVLGAITPPEAAAIYQVCAKAKPSPGAVPPPSPSRGGT